MKAFRDLRIVEIAGSVAGAYAGKLFSDFGATVLKVEPPDGDPARAMGERWNGMGTLFAYLNTGKRSLVLDAASDAGRRRLGELLGGADVVLESSAPDPLVPLTADVQAPHLVKVYVSPFGSTGPYAHYRSTHFTDFAIGGHLFMSGEPKREPLQGPDHQSTYSAGTHAFLSAMAALWARERMGRGQTVEISHFETMVALHQYTTVMWTYARYIQPRVGNRQPGPWHPNNHLRCKDGYVSINAPGRVRLQTILRAMDLEHLLEDPRFATDQVFLAHRDEFDAAIGPWLRERTRDEVTDLLQALRVPTSPLRSLQEVLDYDHFTERGFWRTLHNGAPVRLPRGPFTIEAHDSEIRPAPLLNEAAADATLLAAFRRPPPVPAHQEPPAALKNGPLDGVRVLDLTAGWAGPLGARLIADLGAEMVRVESPWARGPMAIPLNTARAYHLYADNDPRPHPWNRQGSNNKLNRNRRGMALRLDTPEGIGVIKDLIASVDVVMQNFTPRVMPNLGLAYPQLRAINPHVVYVMMPGFGNSGCDSHFAALGPMIEAAAGVCTLMGYDDSMPYRQGMAFPDAVSGMHGACAALVALWDRTADPERRGRMAEEAQVEATVAFIGHEIFARQVRGSEPHRRGNRDPYLAPQGAYPCRGEDRWIAISITDDAAWQALCAVAGFDGAWASMAWAEREARHGELDTAIGAWTRGWDQYALMHTLQARGIAACAVLDAAGMVADPHLAARGFFVWQQQHEAGCFPTPGLPAHFSATPIRYRYPGPRLGEHNHEVLEGDLGYSRERVAALEAAGVLATRPPL